MRAKLLNQIPALFVIWFLFLSVDISFADDATLADLFPLVVGSSYTYRYTDNFSQQSRSKATITKDTIINGKKYFLCKGFPGLGSSALVRYDSARSNILIYTGNASCSNYSGEIIMDSLGMTVNNVINCSYGSVTTRRCTSIGSQVVFGQKRMIKSFRHDGLIYANINYLEGVGIWGYCSGEPPPCTGSFDLIGFVMNGVVYGDTLLTGIQQNGTAIPDKFLLAQNYPNPFNPETIISFAIPNRSFVSLKIYNNVGAVMETLVNENLNTGYYNYNWNAQNYPSGIYYYKIETGEFAETRKMILLK